MCVGAIHHGAVSTTVKLIDASAGASSSLHHEHTLLSKGVQQLWSRTLLKQTVELSLKVCRHCHGCGVQRRCLFGTVTAAGSVGATTAATTTTTTTTGGGVVAATTMTTPTMIWDEGV